MSVTFDTAIVGGHVVRYVDASNSLAPDVLVLIHGFPLGVQMWEPQFSAFDGCGDGHVDVGVSGPGLVDKIYNLWERNPMTVRATYLASNGTKDAPPASKLPSY